MIGGKAYILMIRGDLHVSSMEYNLLPPFKLREAGIKVREIQCSDLTEDDYVTLLPETGLRIPLSLICTLSFFSTTKPSGNDLVNHH